MLYNKLKLYKQQKQQLHLRKLTIHQTKMRNQSSAFSGKSMEETQRQILASSMLLPVPEAEDKNPRVDTSCNMARQVTCPQLVSNGSASASWNIT